MQSVSENAAINRDKSMKTANLLQFTDKEIHIYYFCSESIVDLVDFSILNRNSIIPPQILTQLLQDGKMV